MKTCSRCKVSKPRDDFYKNTRYRDGLQSYCKPCSLAVGRESASRNREKMRAKNKKWSEDNPERRQLLNFRRRLRRFGLTEDQYATLLASQGGRCAICRADEAGWYKNRERAHKDTSWHIDHDHACCPPKESCGQCVRALLCSRCNVLIGQAGEDWVLLEVMADYVRQGGTRHGQILRVVGE